MICVDNVADDDDENSNLNFFCIVVIADSFLLYFEQDLILLNYIVDMKFCKDPFGILFYICNNNFDLS